MAYVRNGHTIVMAAVCKFCLLVAVIPVIQSSGRQQDKDNTCVSPQYVELGRTGTINCTFQDDLFSLLWYDTADYKRNEPVLSYQRSVKTGVGYESGEYDIHPNGSLSINRVSLQHNRTFSVACIPTVEDVPTFINVGVIVTHDTLVKCSSPQYGNSGKVGIIRCNIAIDFDNISWYKEGLDDAIVRFDRKTTKDALVVPGNENAEYSLLMDGSLLIFEVEPEKSKGKYKTELIDSNTFEKLSQSVEFIVMDGTPISPSTTTVPRETYSTTTIAQNMCLSQSITVTHQGRFDVLILVINILILLLTGLIGASTFMQGKKHLKFDCSVTRTSAI
ncbi:hypothetical protein HOLleu_00920 [Holothuria leucospilota]|uniref:Ig-like domain-containing protein n=1 Tax=Holothuria leucospilota TaxID=206669 RepID=A0A9Q1CQB6_HOLLE|nr:hypothetical protein HOLleu_00920 [Holothuria leucospilota]